MLGRFEKEDKTGTFLSAKFVHLSCKKYTRRYKRDVSNIKFNVFSKTNGPARNLKKYLGS